MVISFAELASFQDPVRIQYVWKTEIYNFKSWEKIHKKKVDGLRQRNKLPVWFFKKS